MIYKIFEQLGIEIDEIDILESSVYWFCDGHIVKSGDKKYIAYVACDKNQIFFLEKVIEAGNEEKFDLCQKPVYAGKLEGYLYAVYNFLPLPADKKLSVKEGEDISAENDAIQNSLDELLKGYPVYYHDKIKESPEYLSYQKILIDANLNEYETELVKYSINPCLNSIGIRKWQPKGYQAYLRYLQGNGKKEDVLWFDVQKSKSELVYKANKILDDDYQCLVSLIEDRIQTQKLLSEVEPNFIYNRFDRRFNNSSSNHVVHIKYKERGHYIPIHIENNMCELGVWLTPLLKNEFEQVISFVFKKFRNIYKIHVEYSLNYTKGLNVSNHWKVELPETEDEFKMKLGKDSRRNPKRYLRRVEDQHICRFDHLVRNQITDDIVCRYFEFKRKTHNAEYGMTPKEYLDNFYVTDADLFYIDGNVEAINFLNIDRENKTSYFENISYNEKFKSLYLGTILYYKSIVNLIRGGVKIVFLADGSYDYKKRYGGSNQAAYCGYIQRPNAAWYYSVEDKLFRIVNRIYNKLRKKNR